MQTHSAGILDYANLNYLDMPSTGYQLGYPTSRSKRIAGSAKASTTSGSREKQP